MALFTALTLLKGVVLFHLGRRAPFGKAKSHIVTNDGINSAALKKAIAVARKVLTQTAGFDRYIGQQVDRRASTLKAQL